jgi:ATP-GRASP peptide maturase of grasp-with-spasm system
MILLMSDHKDNSTVYVSRWLLHWNVPFIRIDGQEKYMLEQVILDNGACDMLLRAEKEEAKLIKMSEVKAVWYRRGELNFILPDISFVREEKLRQAIQAYLETEHLVLEYYFYHLMRKTPHIGTFFTRTVNKLEVLHEAAQLGINIPDTMVTSRSAHVKDFVAGGAISKALYEGFRFDYKHGKYTNYTEKIDEEKIATTFFPSLFQRNIKKEADIRVFYLSGAFYSMAIRSQSNEQTKTDFRKYLKGKGNRSFPFQLPVELEKKLHTLMKNLGMETGSLDLILTQEGEFIFLEVNPVGQFGMTSIPCNYQLEYKIAHKLKTLANC